MPAEWTMHDRGDIREGASRLLRSCEWRANKWITGPVGAESFRWFFGCVFHAQRGFILSTNPLDQTWAIEKPPEKTLGGIRFNCSTHNISFLYFRYESRWEGWSLGYAFQFAPIASLPCLRFCYTQHERSVWAAYWIYTHIKKVKSTVWGPIWNCRLVTWDMVCPNGLET